MYIYTLKLCINKNSALFIYKAEGMNEKSELYDKCT